MNKFLHHKNLQGSVHLHPLHNSSPDMSPWQTGDFIFWLYQNKSICDGFAASNLCYYSWSFKIIIIVYHTLNPHVSRISWGKIPSLLLYERPLTWRTGRGGKEPITSERMNYPRPDAEAVHGWQARKLNYLPFSNFLLLNFLNFCGHLLRYRISTATSSCNIISVHQDRASHFAHRHDTDDGVVCTLNCPEQGLRGGTWVDRTFILTPEISWPVHWPMGPVAFLFLTTYHVLY